MSHQTELRDRINDKLISAMSKGQLPWRKPWSPAKNAGHPGVTAVRAAAPRQRRSRRAWFGAAWVPWPCGAILGGGDLWPPDRAGAHGNPGTAEACPAPMHCFPRPTKRLGRHGRSTATRTGSHTSGERKKRGRKKR